MIGNIIFETPDLYKIGLASGELIRFGTLIKDSTSGQIVAHLQESGLGSSLISGLAGGPIAAVANAALSVYTNVQISQLKEMIKGMEVLQYATLGVSMMGIGVTAMGFYVMDKKLGAIEGQVSNLGIQLKETSKELQDINLLDHISTVRGILRDINSANSIKNSFIKFQHLESSIAQESRIFYGRIQKMLSQPTFDPERFKIHLRLFALCNSGRIECLMRANELDYAYNVSMSVAEDYSSLLDELSPIELANKRASPDARWDRNSFVDLLNLQNEMLDLVSDIRSDIETVISRPYLINTLIENGIDGNLFLDMISEEKNHPLLILPAR